MIKSYSQRRLLLKSLVVNAGYKSVTQFAKQTKAFTGKSRSNALIFAHLKKGCYDIRALKLYTRDLKVSIEDIEPIFVLEKI
jgi:hypothetical protein